MKNNGSTAKQLAANMAPLVTALLEKRIGLILDEIEADVTQAFASKTVVNGWIKRNRQGVYDSNGQCLGFFVNANSLAQFLTKSEENQ